MNNRSPVAQSVERFPVKEDVVGSSPTGGAASGGGNKSQKVGENGQPTTQTGQATQPQTATTY